MAWGAPGDQAAPLVNQKAPVVSRGWESSAKLTKVMLVPPSADGALAEVAEEVVSLVVDQNEGGEVLHLNFPNGFHTEVFEIENFNFRDVIFG